MSFQLLTAVEKFSQKPFQFRPYLSEEDAAKFEDYPVLGSLLSDLEHFWQAKGPCLEVRLTSTGCIVGSFTFGSVLKDTNTKIVAVEELKRRGNSLLVVALDCALTGGVICVFDIFGRGVLRAVRIGEKISAIHVIDHGCETVFPESSPLKYFDGLLAVGTVGGDVFLLDLCKQICENVLNNCNLAVRGEVNNCQMNVLNKQNIHNIKKCIEISVEREEHLAIHLNAVLDSSSEHFILKGEEGDDRVHVNKKEAEVSAFFYAKLMASLFIGYNFGSFQMWDLCSLDLLYTSPLCEDIIPITNFTIQEPADDPKSVCYIWVSFSHNLLYGSELPYAVMYAFYFGNETHVDNYGSLYGDFQHCSIRFQLALGDSRSASLRSSVKGGICLGLQSINENVSIKDHSSLELCLISWLFWDKDKIVNTAVLIFDLNQWYKAQMPATPNWTHCSNYIIKNSMDRKMMSIKMCRESLRQFMGVQKPEEHFCPTSLSFDLCAISEHSVFKIENECQQKIFLNKVLNDQHLALVNPVNFAEEIMNLGLAPLFYDIHNSQETDYQRELLLNVMLEQDQIEWLFEVASELANNAFSSAGLTLYNMIRWAFQRALKIKTSCDKYCEPLFDYSGMKLDKNILHLISNGQYQIKNLWNFYDYISSELGEFVADKDGLLEEQNWFKNVVEYFEVLLWMVGAGLLPEFEAKSGNLLGVPYLVQDLTEFYDRKRAQLRLGSNYTFVGKDCSIFIDKLINSSADMDILREIWQADGGSGLYPPPSLQSLLKTYLLADSDLVFKHFLVTYTLMDVAMTLDTQRYLQVIEMLLKFPQVVHLSKSHTKIIQGFWHLDHGNYETALDCLLDESIRPGDLEAWHHSVMLKTLLTQDKSSLAVRYLQDRNPAIHEEVDLLTVISILVSKKLLDDAFEFRRRHRGKDDSILLNHIFNECNKNGILKSLLCRSFTPHEEQVFLKYLQSTRDSHCEELRIFYYLARSRFLDAFDAYDLDKKRKPDSQGLIGQREASAADNLIQMYKSLMPDVYSQLIDLVRKERANLWIDVPNPQPMSVFVHNYRENVKYKSNYLFAALSKSKQSFKTKTNEIVTEEIPFLRTLVVPRNETDESIPVIKFKAVGDDNDYYGSSPSRKRKLSPHLSKSIPRKLRKLSSSVVHSQLATPIVRRDKRQTMDSINDTGFLPQSILKSSTILEGSLASGNLSENYSSKRSILGLTPRSSVKSNSKPHVQFSDIGSGLLENVEDKTESSVETSGDDVFYSPEPSFEEMNQNDVVTASRSSVQQSKEKLNFDDSATEEQQAGTSAIPADVATDKNTIAPVEENVLTTRKFESPKCRKSYRRSLVNTSSPIRSSARLAKKSSEEKSISNEVNLSPSSPSVQKLRKRQSLSRAVLENNLLKSQNLRLEGIQDDSKKLHQLSCSSISDMSFSDSSLLAFSEEDQGPQDSDASIETENVEVVSKVTEISRTEIHTESLKLGNKVTTRETKEEFHSKTVEKLEDDDNVIATCYAEISQQNPLSHPKTVDEFKDDDNIDMQEKNPEETVDEDKQESLDKGKSVEERFESEEPEGKGDALDIYDDLSSASEDGKEALQNAIKEKELDPVFHQIEVEEYQGVVFENDIEMQELHTCEEPEDIPENEKAFVVAEEVIEINSSSDEESRNVPPQLSSSSRNSFSSDSEGEQIFFGGKQDSEEESSNQSERNSEAEIQQNPLEKPSTSKHSSLVKQKREFSENSSDTSEDSNVELPKNSDKNSSTDDSYDSDASFVKHVIEDDYSNSQDSVEGILEEARRYIRVELEHQEAEAGVEKNSSESLDKDDNNTDLDTSEEDENSDVDDSAFDERIVTPSRREAENSNTDSENSQMTDKSTEAKSQHISPQDEVTSSESSESSHSDSEEDVASEKQSRSIQCTLANTVFKKSSKKEQEPAEDTNKASEEEDDNEEPKLQQSIGLQCNFATPYVKEECLEPTTIKLKTVKRTYKGRNVSADVQATPKLAVSLPTRTYSKKLNVRLFEKNEDNEGNIADQENATEMDENVVTNVAQEEVIATGQDMEENNENAVVHEELLEEDCKGSTDEDASEEEHNKEPKLKESVGSQCNFETPDIKQKSLESTTIKVKTVKRTYRGRNVSVDVDATPKLTVSLPTRIYSKKQNVRRFEKNEEIADRGNATDMEQENVVTHQEIGNIDENMEIIDTDVVVHEEIANIENTDEIAANVAREEIIDNTNTDVEEINEIVLVHDEVANTDENIQGNSGNDRQDISPPLEKTKKVTQEKKQTDAAPIRMTRRRSMLMSQESSESSGKSSEKSDLTTTKPNEEVEDVHMEDKKIENIPEQVDAAPIRMTRRRSMLMSREPSESSDKTSEKDNSQSITSSQSSNRTRSQRFMKFSKEKPESRDTSPLREGLEEKKEGTSKQKTTKKRKSKKILSDIDAHMSIDSDVEGKPQRQEPATGESSKSSNVYARRTSKTSKTRATSVAPLESTKKVGTKRTRSLSTDQPATRKRNYRTKSVDLHETSEGRQLQIVLTAIDKSPKASTSTSKASRKRSTDEQKLPAIKEIDPISLLNKVEFTGQPDPEEAKVYEENVLSLPASPGSLRQTRSTSVLSNASSIKSRLRRASADTVSVASEVSDPPSPPKRHKKKEVEESSVKSVRNTRSRANSASSLKSDTSATVTTRSRSKLPSVLEDIQEEKKSDEEREGLEKPNVKKRGRKRKE